MRYRAKLWLVFLAVTVVASAVPLAILAYHSSRDLFALYQSKALSIAATAATFIDGDTLQQIGTRQDEGSAAYVKLQQQLRRARDANRRADTYVQYVYTLRRAPENPALTEFVVDAEENPATVSHVGDVYHQLGGKVTPLDEAQADQQFTKDQWGTWLSASVPIRDSQGVVVGALGVDIAALRVKAAERHLVLSAVAALLISLLLASGASYYLAGRVTRPLAAIGRTANAIGGGDLNAQVNIDSQDEFGELGAAINAMAAGLREREAVKVAFARYVSREVMDQVLALGEAPTVKGDRRRVTVLFSDIRSFTTLSERMAPEQVVEVLNEYFESMVDVIFRNRGTLDKFIGDGLMVFFGAPVEDPRQEEHAVRTAIEMQQALRDLDAKWSADARPTLRIGIGIHSGAAIVGNIGASRRMEYTAIGDTVNLASRLETATREHEADILISESTHAAVAGLFPTRGIGPIHVKGRSEPVVAYAVEWEAANPADV